MNVLILEDSLERIKEFRVRLAERGWTGTFVSRAKDAISKIKSNTYDLILLDHDLAGGVRTDPAGENTGSAVARYINANPLPSKTTVVIHSINASAAEHMQTLIPYSHRIPFVWTDERFSWIRA